MRLVKALPAMEDGKLFAARPKDLCTKGVVFEALKIVDTEETWAMVQMTATGSRRGDGGTIIWSREGGQTLAQLLRQLAVGTGRQT